ncbi:hypothetical protein V4F39_02600 [Aquincola sp. MAHUQ-54]|uniref:Uncharacterized protein n=1 Tax=Aquincola agrisoli TaxID=3119538 RepID=A0AAW9QBN4_9BURK
MSIELQTEDAPAHLLALMLAAAHGQGDVMQRLDALDAFARLGVSRDRFAEVLGPPGDAPGTHWGDCSWLPQAEEEQLDRWLDAVVDRPQRLLLCRLAADVLGADDSVAHSRRLVLDHALARWHVDPAELRAQRTTSTGTWPRCTTL